MSRRNREYKDVVQKLVGRQTNAARGSPDQQRRLQQRQMLQQLRQHVSEARYDTGEAVSHIQEEMYKMEARLSQPGSLDSDDVFTVPMSPGDHRDDPGVSAPDHAASVVACSQPEKYQSDTLRAMQDLMLKRRQSDVDDHGAVKTNEQSAHVVKDNHMT